MKPVKLAAHRGFSTFYPENTMRAFAEAVKLDIDMLEIDLHMTKDGEIVMMHDHTIDRTTDGSGLIREKTLAEMKALDAGSWKGEEFTGEKVPTFREFLEFMKDYPQLEINVELKDYPRDSGDFAFESCDKAIAMIEEYGISDRIYINTWSGELLLYIARKYNGKYRLHGYYPFFLNHGNVDVTPEEFYSYCHCVCLFNVRGVKNGKKVWCKDLVMNKKHFDKVKQYGCEPWVCFNPDTLSRIRRSFKNGAVGFTCNDPVLAGKFLDKSEARPLGK